MLYQTNTKDITITGEYCGFKTPEWGCSHASKSRFQHYQIKIVVGGKNILLTDYFVSIADVKRFNENIVPSQYSMPKTLNDKQCLSALYAILSDASLVMHNGIDDFISELYGDKMSHEEWKKAEESYFTCEKTYKALKQALTDDEIINIIDDLQENYGM